MKRNLATVLLLSFLAACGDDGYGGGGAAIGGYPVGSPITPLPDATFSVSVANYDSVDYTLWMEWQDDWGNLNQVLFAAVPAGPAGSYSLISQDWSAISGFPYWLVLADPSGAIIDSLSLGILSSGQIAFVNISVVGGAMILS